MSGDIETLRRLVCEVTDRSRGTDERDRDIALNVLEHGRVWVNLARKWNISEQRVAGRFAEVMCRCAERYWCVGRSAPRPDWYPQLDHWASDMAELSVRARNLLYKHDIGRDQAKLLSESEWMAYKGVGKAIATELVEVFREQA